MARIRIISLTLAMLTLAGCAGVYVAGDAGAHRDNLSLQRAPSGASASATSP
jgi:hypothetical protein